MLIPVTESSSIRTFHHHPARPVRIRRPIKGTSVARAVVRPGHEARVVADVGQVPSLEDVAFDVEVDEKAAGVAAFGTQEAGHAAFVGCRGVCDFGVEEEALVGAGEDGGDAAVGEGRAELVGG